MITDFCYHYSALYGDTELAEIADRQIRFTEEVCIDPESGFPFHAYNYATGQHSGSSTWGRGVGWYLLGLTSRTLRHPEHAPHLLHVFHSVFRYQDPKGFLYDDLFRQAHIDSSPTCMAALCLAMSIGDGLFEEKDVEALAPYLSKCVHALCTSVTADGKVLHCSGECRAPGEYAASFGNYFSQGYTLALFTMIGRNETLQRLIRFCEEGDK